MILDPSAPKYSERIEAILAFWFGTQNSPDYGKERSCWFIKNPEFDGEIRDRFLFDYKQAASGALQSWETSAQGSLALIIVLDQFPRNLFRQLPEAFATDSDALRVANHAIAQGYDQQLLPVQRWFVYLPFEHSEQWDDQVRSLQLWESLREDPASAGSITYAERHAEVIKRFGRFPHRNAILGRPSTAEELEFLAMPGSSF